MNKPPSVSALAASVWHDFRRAWGSLVVFQALYKLLAAWLFVPAVGLALAAILARAGHVAVSNLDILDFLLTPFGLLYAALVGIAAVALLLFEQAGIMVIAAQSSAASRPSFARGLVAAWAEPFRITRLGAIKLALLALTVAPFVLLGVLTYVVFLSQHDIYYYLKDRPRDFWLAASVGVVLLLAALAAGMWLYVRWAFALPILLFEKQAPRAALRASRDRVRGAAVRVGLFLLGWLLAALLLGLALEAVFRLVAEAVLSAAGERPVALILVLLVAQTGLRAALSFVTVVGFGLLTRGLYLVRSEPRDLASPEGEPASDTDSSASPWARRLAYLCVVVVLLAPLAVWAGLGQQLTAPALVQVTAHRGHARAAPENTLSAMRKAIESGADYVEMDVQLTGDGKVVLLHDRDLKRVAGVSRRLDELSYDEVRKLDVGRWFGPAFAGERVPTLVEVIRLCRGRIRLNIELKFFGPDRRLAQTVADILREQDVEPDCLVTSLDHDALQEARRHNPRLRTGLIVAHALGDLNRLEVDALSVRADFLTDDVLRRAHRLGREVHVWTVNDAGQMTRLMERGVDNIITSDPDLAIRVRGEWAELTGPERLVLAARLLLGLEP
jgi:glycerophosphoryl diester phosphodiesterase